LPVAPQHVLVSSTIKAASNSCAILPIYSIKELLMDDPVYQFTGSKITAATGAEDF